MYNRIQTEYLTRLGSNLKIPMLQLGEGPKLVLSLYAQHGDEEASAWAFHFAKDVIGKLDLEGITYAAILANPRGVQASTRLIPEKMINLNRDWKRFNSDEARIIDIQVKKFLTSYDPADIYSIDHHDTKWHMRSFFIDPTNTTPYQRKMSDILKHLTKEKLGRKKIRTTRPFLEKIADEPVNTFPEYMTDLGIFSTSLEVPGFVRNLNEKTRTRNAKTHLEVDRCLIEYIQSATA